MNHALMKSACEQYLAIREDGDEEYLEDYVQGIFMDALGIGAEE